MEQKRLRTTSLKKLAWFIYPVDFGSFTIVTKGFDEFDCFVTFANTDSDLAVSHGILLQIVQSIFFVKLVSNRSDKLLTTKPIKFKLSVFCCSFINPHTSGGQLNLSSGRFKKLCALWAALFNKQELKIKFYHKK